MKFPSRDLRQCGAAPHAVPVVNPHGTIVHLIVSNTVDPPHLLRELVETQTGDIVLRGVTLNPSFARAGYTLLEEDYQREPGGKERWEDYQKHMTYVADCESVGQVPEPFPQQLLPQSVLQRQRGEGPQRKTWQPTSKPLAEATA